MRTGPEVEQHEPRRNLDIECLRAVAVVGVIFHHMQDNLFQPGLSWINTLFHHADFWFGVDLFFAISGFVIARSLLPQMNASAGCWREQKRVIGAFLIRRFWRLIPSAWLWLGLIMLAVIFFNHSGAFGSIRANAMATLAGMLDVANFRFAESFFRYEYGVSFVYWSLSLEEQFYLLLPVLVALLKRRIDVLLAGVFVVQFFLIRTPTLMSVRTDALALGVLLAIAAPGKIYATMNPRRLLHLGWLRVVIPCVLLALSAMLASADLGGWRCRIGVIALISALLVWLASYDADYLLPDGWGKRMLVWIGARSYAMYLIHVPVYFFLREMCFRFDAELPAWMSCLLACGLIAGLSHLNYQYVEQPLRERGRRISNGFRQALVPSSVGTRSPVMIQKIDTTIRPEA